MVWVLMMELLGMTMVMWMVLVLSWLEYECIGMMVVVLHSPQFVGMLTVVC